MTTEKSLKQMIAEAASDKKARDIVFIDMQNVSLVADYFIICSGTSVPQVKAIADNIEEKLQEAGHQAIHREGYREGRWVLLDYGTCVAHIFLTEEREFYHLERLWGDAPQEVYEEEASLIWKK